MSVWYHGFNPSHSILITWHWNIVVNGLVRSQVFSIQHQAQSLGSGAIADSLSFNSFQTILWPSLRISLRCQKLQLVLSPLSNHVGVGWVWYLLILNVNLSLLQISLKQLFQIWVIVQFLFCGQRSGTILSTWIYLNLYLSPIPGISRIFEFPYSSHSLCIQPGFHS